MKLNELSTPVSSKKLNESLSKKFGCTIDLSRFSDTQLEDTQNKLRTKLSQFEVHESFEGMSTNHEYQKTRMFLDIINQEIFEREMTANEKAKEKEIKKKTDKSGMKASMMKQYGDKKGAESYFATVRKRAMDHSVPESWINSALNRIQLGESDTDELAAELTIRYELTENDAQYILQESEEDRAEIIMATKDMVDRVTGWLEDVAAMQAEQLLELLDAIRLRQGSDISEKYAQIVKPALTNIYSSLEQSRQQLVNGLTLIADGEVPTMGNDINQKPSTDITQGIGEPVSNEPSLTGPAATPEIDAGREKRESIDYSRKLGILLSSKKK